jgi:hypothetical protein
MGALAVAAFQVAILLTVQVRGEAQSPAQAGPETEINLCVPPESGDQTGQQAGGSAPPAGMASTIEGEPVLRLLSRDAISSVDAPNMVSVAAAGAFMRDEELVIGVSDGREARAYSIWHLDRHEIVNDRLGEAPIAATW